MQYIDTRIIHPAQFMRYNFRGLFPLPSGKKVGDLLPLHFPLLPILPILPIPLLLFFLGGGGELSRPYSIKSLRICFHIIIYYIIYMYTLMAWKFGYCGVTMWF